MLYVNISLCQYLSTKGCQYVIMLSVIKCMIMWLTGIRFLCLMLQWCASVSSRLYIQVGWVWMYQWCMSIGISGTFYVFKIALRKYLKDGSDYWNVKNTYRIHICIYVLLLILFYLWSDIIQAEFYLVLAMALLSIHETE